MNYTLANTKKAFPTFDGSGDNIGGRNGQIVFITNLNDSGSGSVRQAFRETRVPRIIIPLVAGYNILSSTISVDGNNSPGSNASGNFTYLGMLAPGDGLVIRKRELRISNIENIIIRGLKSRHGNEAGSAAQSDALAISMTSTGQPNNNVIVDRSTFSYSVDEVFSIGSTRNGTVQHCMLSEPLNLSFHDKVRHAYGGLWSGLNMTFHHNLFSNCDDRNPLSQVISTTNESLVDFRRNAIVFWNRRASYMGNDVSINLIENGYFAKPSNPQAYYSQDRFFTFSRASAGDTQRVYPYGNRLNRMPSLGLDVESQKAGIGGTSGSNTTAYLATTVVNTPFVMPVPYVFNWDYATSMATILALVGSPKRDVVDSRILSDWQSGAPTRTGSGDGILGLIDTPFDSYPFGDGFVPITGTPVILTGPAPHYLPAWFTTKYSMSTVYDYTLAGDPTSRPERFIIFKGGQGVQLSQFVGVVNYVSDPIFNVYEVLSFHYVNIFPSGFEIDILEYVEPSPTTYALTLQATTGGSITGTAGNYTVGTTIPLTATAGEGYSFVRWKRIDTNATVSDIANFSFTMISQAVTLEAVFVEDAPIPPIATGDRFFARIEEPIV